MVITAQETKVKPGYKLTEVGVIPEEWSVSKVGVEFEIQLGKMLDAEKNIGFPKPYLGNRAVQWNSIDISDLQTMAMSRSDLERFRLRRGDLLVCEGGEVGRAAIWEAQLEECYYQKALHRLRPLHSFNPRLMLALLQFWTNHGMLADYISQTSIAHLTREKFIEVPMPLPPPAEQQAIATALSDVDALLASLDKLITKKRDIKQATMQQLLTGKTRLPGFSGKWKMQKLGERCEFYSGGTPSTSNSSYYGGSISWITSSDLNKGRIKEVEGKITKQGFENSSAKMVKKGTLLLALYGATAGVTAITEIDAAINQAILAIITLKDNSEFLFQKLTLLKDWLIKTYTQGGQPNLSGQIVKLIELSLPPESEQTAIATVLSDMDAEIAALEQKREKTRALKRAMMQELLTGRIRLL